MFARIALVLLTAAMAPLAIADTAKKEPPARKVQKAPQKKMSTTVPDGAVEVEPGLYRVLDAKGETWFYRRTPFGVVKFQEQKKTEPAESTLKATDLGETVRFESQTPFGPRSWTKKKSELNEEETAALAKQEKPESQP